MDGKRETKVTNRESRLHGQEALEDVLKVDVLTSNRGCHALLKICDQTGHLSESLKNVGKMVNILFDGSNKNSGVVPAVDT